MGFFVLFKDRLHLGLIIRPLDDLERPILHVCLYDRVIERASNHSLRVIESLSWFMHA